MNGFWFALTVVVIVHAVVFALVGMLRTKTLAKRARGLEEWRRRNRWH